MIDDGHGDDDGVDDDGDDEFDVPYCASLSAALADAAPADEPPTSIVEVRLWRDGQAALGLVLDASNHVVALRPGTPVRNRALPHLLPNLGLLLEVAVEDIDAVSNGVEPEGCVIDCGRAGSTGDRCDGS